MGVGALLGLDTTRNLGRDLRVNQGGNWGCSYRPGVRDPATEPAQEEDGGQPGGEAPPEQKDTFSCCRKLA